MTEETKSLIVQAQNGDMDARNQLFEENTGLIWSIARRFMNRGYDLDDIFQIGSIGLLRAIDKFDISYNVQFSTYAVPMIVGEIKRFLRDDGIIKISRSLKELATKVRVIREKLSGLYNREPTLDEIALALQVDVSDVVFALESCTEVESLYKTIYHSDNNNICLLDKIVSKEDETERFIDSYLVRKLINELPEKEQEIIYLRYFKDQTQSEVAKRIGISQVQVSRIEKKILGKMRRKISM